MKLLKGEEEALKRAHECLKRVETIIPMSMRDTTPADVVGGLLSVSLQHHDSILLLLKTRRNKASIDALLRTSLECLLRLLWVIEDEQRANEVTAGKIKFPKLSRLAGQFAKKQNQDFRPLGEAITMLHAGSHADLKQVVNYYPRGRAYKRSLETIIDLQAAAYFVGVLAIATGAAFCAFTKREDLKKQFGELYIDLSLPVVGEIVETIRRMTQKQLKKNIRAARQASTGIAS